MDCFQKSAMDCSQKSAIRRHFPTLVATMFTKDVYQYLYTTGCITKNHYDTLESRGRGNTQTIELIEIVQRIDDGWDNFIKALKHSKQSNLANLLNDSLATAPVFAYKTLLIESLTKLLLKETEPIRKFWSDILHVTELKNAYQPLQLVEKDRYNAIKSDFTETYDYLWMQIDIVRVFIIEGDPGTGKTTYVCRLVQMWVDGLADLQNHFNCIFLIPLRKLERDDTAALLAFYETRLPEKIAKDHLGLCEAFKDKRSLLTVKFLPLHIINTRQQGWGAPAEVQWFFPCKA